MFERNPVVSKHFQLTQQARVLSEVNSFLAGFRQSQERWTPLAFVWRLSFCFRKLGNWPPSNLLKTHSKLKVVNITASVCILYPKFALLVATGKTSICPFLKWLLNNIRQRWGGLVHTDLRKENLKSKKIRHRLYIKQNSLKPSVLTVVSACWCPYV